MAEPDDLDTAIDNALIALKHEAAKSLDPYLCATVIAMTNDEIKKKFKDKINKDHYVPKGVRYLSERDRVDRQYVLFEFGCQANAICLFDPSFLVQVNIPAQRAIIIQDPYTHNPSTQSRRYVPGPCSPFPLTRFYWGLWLNTQIAFWEVLCSPRPLDIEYSPASPRLSRPRRLIDSELTP